jgi:hypothetical protein
MHRMLIGSALALTCSMAVPFAQQQAAPEPAPAHKVYVLTGCLEARADAPAVFMLSNATAIGEAPPASPVVARAAEPGAVGTSGTADTGGTFELQAVSGLSSQGKDEEALKAHTGHRVEVTVRPVEVVAAPTASGALTAAEPARPAEPEPTRYTVTEIKAVPGTCA